MDFNLKGDSGATISNIQADAVDYPVDFPWYLSNNHFNKQLQDLWENHHKFLHKISRPKTYFNQASINHIENSSSQTYSSTKYTKASNGKVNYVQWPLVDCLQIIFCRQSFNFWLLIALMIINVELILNCFLKFTISNIHCIYICLLRGIDVRNRNLQFYFKIY